MIVDFSRAHLWDAAAIAALDAIEGHYRRLGVKVSLSGLNEPSEELRGRLSGQMSATR